MKEDCSSCWSRRHWSREGGGGAAAAAAEWKS